MNRQRIVGLLVMVAGLGMGIGSMVRMTDDAEADPAEKVKICHATSSETNPYIEEEVALSAVDGDGTNDHMGHTGPVWYPGAKDDGVQWGDIIPPVAGTTPGLNWVLGQATYNNGCVLPATTTSTTTTSTTTTTTVGPTTTDGSTTTSTTTSTTGVTTTGAATTTTAVLPGSGTLPSGNEPGEGELPKSGGDETFMLILSSLVFGLGALLFKLSFRVPR